MEMNPAPEDTPIPPDQPDTGAEIVPLDQKRRILCNQRKNMLNKPKYKSKRLLETTTQCRKRIAPITQILKEIYQRNFFSRNEFRELRNLLTDDLVTEISSKKIPENSVYSFDLMTFACTLHFFSQKAYKYVRKTFQTCLPHSRIVKRWFLSRNAEPGFTKESLQAIKHKVVNTNHKVVFNLVMDEIILKQQVEFDGREHHGYVQICDMAEQDAFLPEAREVLLFSLTAINEDETIPIGYFFVKNANESQRATLVKTCLELLEETGAEVSSLSFDASMYNLTMAKELGCNFEAADLKTHFEHPISKKQIHIFIYPCRLVMLLRDSFQENFIFLDDTNRQVNFGHLCNLNYIRGTEKFVLAHMFKVDHIFFNGQNMEGGLTSHIFNDSIADLLDHCSKLKITNFDDVEGTVNFLKIINVVYDVLTSRSMAQLDHKKPLCPSNKELVLTFLEFAEAYILSLRVLDETKVVNIFRKSGFVGFLVNIISTRALYNQSIEEEKLLECLPMNKITQFHNENLFGQLCAQSEDITARQFKELYKKFIIQTELGKNEFDNFMTFERISIFTRRSAIIKDMNRTSKMTYYEYREQELNKILFVDDNEVHYFMEDLSEFNVKSIIFIAGFLVHALLRKMKCRMCINALIRKDIKDRWRYHSVKIKDPMSYFYVSDDVVDICRKMEKVIKTRKPQSKADFANENFHNIIMTKTLSEFIGVQIFKDLEYHQYEQSPIHNHAILLTKAVMEKYLEYRLRLMGLIHPTQQV